MNTSRTIFGLSIVLLFIVSVATAYSGSCCEWGRTSTDADWGCIGNCGAGTECTQVGSATCQCLTDSDEGCHWEVDECVGTCSLGGSCVMTEPEQCGCQTDTCHYDRGDGCIGTCFTSGECIELEPGYCACGQDVCRWGGDGCVGTCGSGECVQDGSSYSCSCSGTPECVQEGASYPITFSVASPECCSGLAAIGCSAPDSEGFCGEPCVGAMVCAQCGNGVCGLGENKCNCPTDCTTTSVPEFATGLVALAVMLLSPAFAYLAVRKRH